jgi:hypothetical protein
MLNFTVEVTGLAIDTQWSFMIPGSADYPIINGVPGVDLAHG